MPFVDGPQATPAAGGGGFVDAPKPDSTNELVAKYSKMYGVPEDFAQRIRGRESGGTTNPSTVTSSAGARGIYQLMPGTFKEQNVGNDITNPEQNINAGLKYLGSMLKRYNGDQRLAAAAYNAGPGAVDAAGGQVPHIKETQAYAQATAPSGFVDAPASAGPKPTGGFVDSAPPGLHQATRPIQHAPNVPQNVPQNVPTPQAGNAPPAGGGVPHSPVQEPQGLNPLQALVHGGLMAGTNVMGGLNAVMGAPQRAEAAALTGGNSGAILRPFDEARQGKLQHDLQEPRMLLKSKMSPQEIETWRSRMWTIPGMQETPEGFTSPTSASDAAAVGGFAGGMAGKVSDAFVSGLRDLYQKAPGLMAGVGGVVGTPHKVAPQNNEHFLSEVGKAFGAQWITDPLQTSAMYKGLEGAVNAHKVMDAAHRAAESVGAKVPALKHAATAAKDYHDNLIKPKLNQIFGTRPELDPLLDTSGKAARLSIEEKNLDKMAEEGARQNDLAKKYKTEITNAKTFHDLPSEIQQESMREAWRYGTPEMRAKVEQDVHVGSTGKTSEFGFHPTQEDLEKFPEPLGIVKYDPREHYTTLISPKPPAKYSDMDLFQEYGAKPAQEHAGFEKQARADNPVHDDMYERTLNRWKLGRNVIKQRMTDADTKAFLLEHGGSRIPATAENVDAITSQLSHSPKSFDIPGYSTTARNLARAGIQLNPFPHGLKNVGDLAELAGGPEAFGKGLAYAAKGLSPQQTERLKNMGVSIDYLRGAHGPVTALATKIGSQAVLQRLELGYRQSLLDQLDREGGAIGHLPDEYAKAQKIRDALGDYRNTNAFTAALQAIGGPFVAFRTSVTPKAVGRALLKAPGRVESRARVSEDVNQELHKEGQPGSFHYGGPVEDVARMASKPFDYAASSATVGPIISALMHVVTGKTGPIQAGKQAAESYIPAMQEIMPLLKSIPGVAEWLQKNGIAFHEPAGITPFNDAMNTAFGSHFENPTSATRRREIERQSRQ